MNTLLLVLATGVAAYLLGAIPFGLIISRWRGVDIRAVGSRNIGATNVFRSVGKPWGIATFVLDMGKGWCGAVAVPVLVARLLGVPPPEPIAEWRLLGGVCAVVGHTWPVYLGFKGKGVVGAAQTLLRAGVASLLNASFNVNYVAPDHPAAVEVWDETLGRYVLMSCTPGADGCSDPVVYWPYTPQGVIEAVNAALATLDRNEMLMLATELDGYNNGTHWIDWALLP